MLQEEFQNNTFGSSENSLTSHTSLHPRLAWIMFYKETGSVQEVCKKFGISRKTFYKWLKRYRNSNEDCSSLSDRSRRPRHSPRATPPAFVAVLQQARLETGFGQRRLRLYLQEHHNISISERTIWKILKRFETPQSEPIPENGGSNGANEELTEVKSSD